MVFRTILTALLALRALSSASLALSDACSTTKVCTFTGSACRREQSLAEGGSYHGGHHHVVVGLGLLPRQFLFGGAQLTHHVVHLAVQRAGVLEGLLGVFFGLGGGLRAEPTISQQTVGKWRRPLLIRRFSFHSLVSLFVRSKVQRTKRQNPRMDKLVSEPAAFVPLSCCCPLPSDLDVPTHP